MQHIPGRGWDIRHGNGIAESIGTRGKRKDVGIGGSHLCHPVAVDVAAVCHFKALAFCLSCWSSRSAQIILEFVK